MSWPKVAISRVAQIVGGGTPSKANGAYWTGHIPWISPKDMSEFEIFGAADHITEDAVTKSATQIVPSRSVLIVVRSGILVRRLPVALTRVPVALNQDMKAFICGETVLPEFLAYFLQSKEGEILSSCIKRGATVQSIDMSRLSGIAIPIPPVSEQRRVVELLDEAARLRKLRRQADAKAARILPTLFLKMFGDPATNPMRWQVRALRSAIANVEPGWSAPSEPRERAKGELGVLKVSAVTSGRFRPEEHKTVTEGLEGRALITPRTGDLLFSRANTRELVAATCVVEQDYPWLFLSDKLWRVSPRPKETTSLFLKTLLTNEFVRDQIRAKASGSSGSMLNVSQEAVLRLEVPIPPFAKQEVFTAIGWNVLSTLRICDQAASGLEVLWDELLSRAFSGNLTKNWRAARMTELLIEMQDQARVLDLPMPDALKSSL